MTPQLVGTPASPVASTVAVGRVPEGPPAHMPRPRLTARIEAGLRGDLTLVIGPAGHGKTTAVADTCRRLASPVAWITLRGPDRDPLRAWLRIAGSVDAALGLDVAAPHVHHVSGLDDDFDRAEARWLEADTDLVVVLDDAGDVLLGPSAHIVDRFLDVIPHGFRVAVLARQEPALSLPRRRSKNDVAAIGVDELRFDAQEVTTYLNGVRRVALDAETIARLAAQTEGWPAALHLLAAASNGHELTPGSSAVVDYVTDEVLPALPRDVERFLYTVAPLEVLTAELCDAATATRASARRLGTLARAGLVVPREDGIGFRLHRLVRAVVARPAARVEKEDRRTLLRAGAHAAAEGRWQEAVGFAVTSRHWSRAVTWAAAAGPSLAADGGVFLRQLGDQIPAVPLLAHHGLASAVLDGYLAAGDTGAIERLLDVLDTEPTTDGHTAALASRARGFVARLRGEALTPESGGRARDVRDPVTAHVRGVSHGMQGSHDAAAQLLTRATRAARREQAPLLELTVLADLVWERATAGRVGESDLLARRAVRLSRTLGLARPPVMVRLARAQIALDRGRPDVALVRIAGCREELDRSGDAVAVAEADLLLAHVRASRGDLAGAAAVLDHIDERYSDSTLGTALAARVVRAVAGLRLSLGDLESLLLLVPDLLASADATGLHPGDRLLLARIRLRQNDLRAAGTLAASVGSDAGPRLCIQALRVVAATARASGDAVAARRAHSDALALARAEGLLPTRAPRTGSLVCRCGLGMADATDPLQASRPLEASPRIAAVTDPLTEREDAVLRWLPSRLSNGEIAHELSLSINTVKSHVKAIYRKLDVATRRDAITRAQELGLL